MGLFDWLAQQISGDAKQRARVVVADDHNLTGRDQGVRAIAEQHYVRLWISEMFLKKGTAWFTSRFPLAYSLIALDYAGQKVEVANVSGKNKFEIKQPDINNSILRNYALTPLLPFRGGTMEVDCGLVSMEASNGIQSFAAAVSDIAAKVNVAQVATIAGIAGSIAEGVQALLGAGKAETKLYVHDTFASDTLHAGYIFLSGKKRSEVEGNKIWITNDGVRTGTSAAALSELDPQDYMIIRVEIMDKRDDWRSMKAIADPLDLALDAKYSGDAAKAATLVGQAKLAALKSADLTQLDKKRVILGIDAEFNGTGAAPLVAALDEDTEPLSALERAVARISTEEASAAPDFTAEMIEAEAGRGNDWG